MFQQLENLNELSIYPVISLVIFLTLFAVILIRVVTVDKNYLNKMKNLPLDAVGKEEKNEGKI